MKRHYRLIHVEAGLRSFNRRMPEEINRIVADHVCDVLLAPTQTAIDNLKAENLAQRTVFTGDVMYDTVLFNSQLAEQRSNVLVRMALTPGSYGIVTIHRAENTGASQLRNILDTLNTISAQQFPIGVSSTPTHPCLPGRSVTRLAGQYTAATHRTAGLSRYAATGGQCPDGADRFRWPAEGGVFS